MAMVKMISEAEHEYPMGTKRSPGDPFEAEAKDVELLIVLGRATRAGGMTRSDLARTFEVPEATLGFEPTPNRSKSGRRSRSTEN